MCDGERANEGRGGSGTHGSHQQITTRDHNVLQQHQPQRRAHLRHLRRRLHNLRSRRGVRLWVVPPAQHTPARPVSSGRTPPNAPIQCTLGWRRGGLRGILGSWWTPGVHYPLSQCQYRSSVSETRLHALKKGLPHPWSPLALIRLFTAGAHFALVGQPLGAFLHAGRPKREYAVSVRFLTSLTHPGGPKTRRALGIHHQTVTWRALGRGGPARWWALGCHEWGARTCCESSAVADASIAVFTRAFPIAGFTSSRVLCACALPPPQP